MVKGFFEQLGCQTARVYDVGITEWGAPGNPVVYAKCDDGAPRTIAIYWQYDTMPVTQPDAWMAAAFRGAAGRAAAVQEGADRPRRHQLEGPGDGLLNALMSIKAVTGKLPVNLIFVAEGDEERMDIGLRKFVKDHPDLFKGADALIGEGGGQAPSGGAGVGGGSEGCVYVELTTSGKAWGRGPVQSDIHGSQQARRRQPGVAPHQDARLAGVRRRQHPADQGLHRRHRSRCRRRRSERLQEGGREDRPEGGGREHRRRALHLRRSVHDAQDAALRHRRSISTASGAATCTRAAPAPSCPNKITSKHNIRYVPRMNGLDIVKRIREQLDATATRTSR